MKRIDYMCLEAISTGYITINTTNNPDGTPATTPIDLLMPADNFQNPAVSWDTAATATPFADILQVVKNGEDAGKTFSKILMTRSRFFKLVATVEVRNMVSGMLRIGTKEQVNPTMENVNQYLEQNLLPTIELVNEVIGIEKDGVITTYRPFKDENVVFLPAGKLGKIHNAIAIEALNPVSGIAYANYNGALISKWSENEPFGEYTKVEFNAFPGLEAIDGIYILTSTTVA